MGERVQLPPLRSADQRDSSPSSMRATWPTVEMPTSCSFRDGDRPNAPQALDLEWMEERELLVGRHEE